MREKLQNLKNEAVGEVIEAQSATEIDRLRVHYLGKKGMLAEIATQIPGLPNEEKIEVGRLFNDVKVSMSIAFNS